MKHEITLVLLALALTGCAGTPYIEIRGETSCNSGCEIQLREEVGIVSDDGFEAFVYHESDPRNGFEGSGWPRESENGAGIGKRWRLE